MSGASDAPAPPAVPHQGSMSVYPVRIPPGADMVSFLQHFVLLHELPAAFIVTCVGSVKKVTLRFATNAEGRESVLDITENMEICALSGTVSQEGFHLHGTFGNAVGGTISGHIVGNMVVQTTAEIVLGNAGGWKFKREYDPKTGFRELKVVPLPGDQEGMPLAASVAGGQSSPTVRQFNAHTLLKSVLHCCLGTDMRCSIFQDEDIRSHVRRILEGANLEELTMKDICKKVFENYPDHDLADKKDMIMSTINSVSYSVIHIKNFKRYAILCIQCQFLFQII
ncbi:hypothetical protein ONE63_004609 [Megalurothrips usitatus]|uniref:PPC domain-containing protein n=1 Tax=Megalurothrips usitatus TaxID=439358 RepID=A0AAV7X091_9NEOP|nr:hypothetical protein ONE63_004609 [Megalurothrips usitatus]